MFKIIIFFKSLIFKNFCLKILNKNKLNLCKILIQNSVNIKQNCGGYGKCDTCVVFINESSQKKINKFYKKSCLINFFFNIIITI